MDDDCRPEAGIARPSSPGNEDQVRLDTEAIVRTVGQPLLVLNGKLTVRMANPAFYSLFQTTPETTLGRPLYCLGNAQWDTPALRRLLEDVLTGHTQLDDYRVEHGFEQIGERIMLLHASRLDRPGRRAPHVLLAISDVTELERARSELEGRKEFAEKIVDATREALLVLGWDLRVHRANEAFYQTFEVDAAETEGRMVYELGNGQWAIPRLRHLLEDILPREQTFDDYEVEHEFERIGRRTMLLNARRIDHLQLILLAIRDVTEQRRAEVRQTVLMSELQHRVNNILANVRSISMQTRQHSETIEEFTEAFDGRIGALARTQDLLTRRPEGDISLRTIVARELEARGAREGEDFSLSGPELAFPPSAAQAIGLTFHELGTNAAKYGALAAPPGRIELSWRVDGAGAGDVIIRWRETGVKLDHPPRRKGFGSRIIEQSLPYMLGGTSEMIFHSDGVECVIRFPLPGREARG